MRVTVSAEGREAGATARLAPHRARELLAVVRVEAILMARRPVDLLAGAGQVLVMVALFTTAALLFAVTPEDRARIAAVMGYGFVVFFQFTEGLWGVGYSVRRDQRQGILEQMRVAPAAGWVLLVGRAAMSSAWTVVLCAAASLTIALLAGGLPASNVGTAGVVLLATVLGSAGVGIAFAGASLRLGDGVQSAASFVQFAFMIVCAPFFQFSAMPAPLLAVARFVPLSYCVDALRSALMGYPAGFPELASTPVELAIVAAFGAAAPVGGLLVYGRAERWARVHGRLSGSSA